MAREFSTNPVDDPGERKVSWEGNVVACGEVLLIGGQNLGGLIADAFGHVGWLRITVERIPEPQPIQRFTP